MARAAKRKHPDGYRVLRTSLNGLRSNLTAAHKMGAVLTHIADMFEYNPNMLDEAAALGKVYVTPPRVDYIVLSVSSLPDKTREQYRKLIDELRAKVGEHRSLLEFNKTLAVSVLFEYVTRNIERFEIPAPH